MPVKNWMALLMAVTFLAGMAGPALAAEKPQDKATMDKAGDKKMPAKNANGTVKSASADSVVVAGKDKGKDAEWTFAVEPKTKIKKGGKDISAGDLKAGDSVHVRYMDHDGKSVAQTINVRAGSTARKDAPAAGTTR